MWFINSPFFGALITLATGLIAIGVYKSQKADEKINAATSILFEIRNAEAQVSIISDKLHSNSTQDLPSVLPANSWRKFSHLFAKDFDEDELKLVNSFYSSCEDIEDLVTKQNNFIWISTEEKAKVAQRSLAEIYLKFQRDSMSGGQATLEENKRKLEAEKLAITKLFGDEGYTYTPAKPTGGLKFQVDRFQNITTATCGAKLKKLAKV